MCTSLFTLPSAKVAFWPAAYMKIDGNSELGCADTIRYSLVGALDSALTNWSRKAHGLINVATLNR